MSESLVGQIVDLDFRGPKDFGIETGLLNLQVWKNVTIIKTSVLPDGEQMVHVNVGNGAPFSIKRISKFYGKIEQPGSSSGS